jgi:hypothetical protein
MIDGHTTEFSDKRVQKQVAAKPELGCSDILQHCAIKSVCLITIWGLSNAKNSTKFQLGEVKVLTYMLNKAKLAKTAY